jgi:SAM-dependent methyltransferase
MNPEAMTPYGMALVAYEQGQIDAEIVVRRDDGFEAPVPASHFFREPKQFSPIETAALDQCEAPVLDVGAGAGIHSLALQARGVKVTAIDIDPHVVALMLRRGVAVVRRADVFTFQGGPFSTVLLLGHGIGMVGDLDGLDAFLAHAHSLIRRDGQILLDSLDVTRSQNPTHLAYHEANRKQGRYVGETRIEMAFEGEHGAYCGWLHVDALTLAEHAERVGWACEVLFDQSSGEYLARLTPHLAA